MLLVDNVVTAPMRGLFWVFREVHKAAEESLRNEYQAIASDLSGLYLMLENGEIDEKEFNVREQRLLDRMDELEEQGYGGNSYHAGDDED